MNWRSAIQPHPLRHPGLEPGSIGWQAQGKRALPWGVRLDGPGLKAGVTSRAECSPLALAEGRLALIRAQR